MTLQEQRNKAARLGVDPAEFVVACSPVDAYVRLAPKYGCGQLALWTHFDGYPTTDRVHHA